MKLFRNTRLNLFLSFWLLWSTVGIKVYLEYCSCSEDIHFNLFELQNNSCSASDDYVVNLDEQKLDDVKAKSCCEAKAEKPACPPKGCDSQDVQEFKVHSPFIPSSVEDLSIDLTSDYLFEKLPVVFTETGSDNCENHIHVSDVCLTSLEYRILLQSFLC